MVLEAFIWHDYSVLATIKLLSGILALWAVILSYYGLYSCFSARRAFICRDTAILAGIDCLGKIMSYNLQISGFELDNE